MAEDYTYIVARIRSIEAAMPDRTWYQRLTRSPEAGLLSSIREFHPGFEGVATLSDFEEGLERERAARMDLITGLITTERTRFFLRAGYDLDNALHVWKAKRLGEAAAINPFGLVGSIEAFERAVADRDYRAVPPHVVELLGMLGGLDESISAAEAVYRAESAGWNIILRLAPSPEARRFVEARIDTINISSFVRLKRIPIRSEAVPAVWIGGGRIEPARLSALFKEAEEGLYSFLGTTDYRSLGRAGVDRNTPLWKIDAMLRTLRLELAGGSNYRFFDITPVLYHLELLDRNEALLRSVVTGKLNSLPEELIAERVDALWPA